MHEPTRNQQVRRVLWITLFLNLAVAASKIVVGLATGALAITADGLHSISDSAGSVGGLIATRIADQPPDDDHPYGHSRFETLAALVIGLLLLVTAWEIVRGALDRLSGENPPVITPLAFGVMLATLAVNIFISRYQMREGRRLQSQILVADASHTRVDVFVTLSVIASMIVIQALGWDWVDIAAALLITLLVVKTAWDVLRRAVNVLVDKAPYEPETLQRLVQEVPSVDHVRRVRSRGPANDAHIDVDVQVSPAMTADQTAAIAGAIRDKLRSSLGGVSEVIVRFMPQRQTEPDYPLVVRARADALGLATHEVRVSERDHGRVLEMHVEVPPGQTLDSAHAQVSQLEAAIQRDLPDVVDVISHIEPALGEAETSADAASHNQHMRQLEHDIAALLAQYYPGLHWHDVSVQPFDRGYVATMHVTLPPHITVETAHRMAENTETRLRSDMPQLARVVIHTEPPEDE
jgi:cation diffusion facilitator family transporter